MPQYIIYDDACHLKKFVQKRVKENPTDRLVEFNKYPFIVDKLHIQGHVDPWCLANCNPKDHADLKGCNTMVCKQINFFLGGN